ncbi:hypothetical protein WG922_07205 [Ramlibacter sp. AN1015]|uniref:hypothetical protein n=1 Tax=Ramlibacter sp. AN1015 TaxID=3133428 RepID=UPI0030BF20A8
MTHKPLLPRLARVLSCACAAALLALPSHAQEGYCASDGQPRPRALVERFINADCATCWADPAAAPVGPRELALDWIVPGQEGDEAPLSAAALPEALERLAQHGRQAPSRLERLKSPLVASARTLRVSHGMPFNDYIGTSIELRPAGRAPWKAWLLLVETIPAGTEGTQVERNLVRAALQPPWTGSRPPSRSEEQKLLEMRSMRVPEGARPERLRVVGWVEDARGRIRVISESRCRHQEGRR